MKFIAAGNVMVDEVELSDGSRSTLSKGGPSFFALVGMKLWTDDCLLRSNVGADFNTYFKEWFENNHVSMEGIEVRAEHCNRTVIRYHEDGSYEGESKYGLENMGFLRCRPEDLRKYCKGAKGVYLAQDADPVVWEELLKVRDELGFRMMWEIEARWAIPDKMNDIVAIAKRLDMFSMNMNEACILFSMDKSQEQQILEKIAQWDVPFVFMRAGSKGSYAIADRKITFIPSIGSEKAVDSTGCGNCSTGAATYAFASGFTAEESALMGNIAAYFNVLQYGVPENIESHREEAQRLFAQGKK